MQRLVKKRNTCPGAEPVDFTKTGKIASMRGWIYTIYQFSTGRVYVGQTIGTLLYRTQQHWWERTRVHDLFHQALVTEQNPFSFVILPLEKVPERIWTKTSWKESKEQFRKLATGKERLWVKKLNTMWPPFNVEMLGLVEMKGQLRVAESGCQRRSLCSPVQTQSCRV